MNECCKAIWSKFATWVFWLQHDRGIVVTRIVLPCGHEWQVYHRTSRHLWWHELGQMRLPLGSYGMRTKQGLPDE